MRWPAVRRAAAAWAGLLLLAACAKGGADVSVPRATVATEASTTTTTNPYAVPAVIDANYVNRVLAGLDAVFGDAFRLMVSTKSVGLDSLDRIKSVYGDRKLLNLQLKAVQDAIQFNLPKLPPVPGNKKTTVVELITSRPECIYASVTRDYSAFNGRQDLTNREWIALKPLDASSDPNHYNPTQWAYVYEGFDENRNAPSTSPCAVA